MRKRKILSILLTVVVLLALIPTNTFQADETAILEFENAATACWSDMESYYNAAEIFNEKMASYDEVRNNFNENVNEFYEAAVIARAVCETAYHDVEESFAQAEEKYEILEDDDKNVVSEQWAYLEANLLLVTENWENLEEVPPIEGGIETIDTMETIYINEDGVHGVSDAPLYWKINENGLIVATTEEDYTIKIEMTEFGANITMRNFMFTCAAEYNADAIWCEIPVTLTLEGENEIIAESGNAFGIIGDLTVEGNGSLALISTSGEIVPDNGDDPYIPNALFVAGKFTNHATIFCDSKNPDNTVFIDCVAKDIVNTGEITVGEDQKIGTQDILCDTFVEPEYYDEMEDYPVPSDHVYVAKVYYYTPDIMYPNTIYGHEGDTDQWTVYGNYDADGNPIGSNVWYQYWYVDERGGILTEDLVNPVQFLVYEENPESLIQDKDIVSISDGETHVFNADLYALWFTDGNVTVNGNIIQDFACFNVAERELAEDGDYLKYVFDQAGNRVWLTESSSDSKVVVNGNVSLLSLNDSFEGNVTVNGNVSLIGFYEDMHPSVTSTLDFIPETFYGSKANAGQIIQNGVFVGISTEAIDGFLGYSVFNTEDFYTQTERRINGEIVHGTVAVINQDSLLVDVTKDVVGADTWPCVKEVSSTRHKTVESLLTNKNSKLMVMDISLIQANKNKVEPSTTLNLYFDDITGFEKPAIYHIKDNGEVEKLFVYDGLGKFGGSITCKTGSFSTYFIAENQELTTDLVSGSGNTTTTPPSDTNKTPPANNENIQNQNNSVQPISPKTGEENIINYVICFVTMCGMFIVLKKKKA